MRSPSEPGLLEDFEFAQYREGPSLVCLPKQCPDLWSLHQKLSRLIGARGQRIGEASHPGPGGKAAARWKQYAKQQTAQVDKMIMILQAVLQAITRTGSATGLEAMLGSAIATASPPSQPEPTQPCKVRATAKAKPKAKVRPQGKDKPKAKAKSAPTPAP